MLILPLLFATLASALPQSILRTSTETEYTILDQTLAREISSLQHILDASKSKYKILSSSLVHEIDQLRQDWHIKGAGIAVVRLKDDGEWEQDTLGIGIADGAGNAVTEHVSRYALLSCPSSSSRPPDALRHGLELETVHGHRSGSHRCQQNIGLHPENQDQGRCARVEADGSHCFGWN